MKIQNTLSTLRNQFEISETMTLGLDIGIASCGWALLDVANKEILGAGTWGFEIPEVPKTRESKAAVRRGARGQRRRLRRRRQRMRDIRLLLYEHDLLSSALPAKDQKDVPKSNLDPWLLRNAGLERRLSGAELATTLIHIAKHRGYRSNSKSDKASNAPMEDQKVLVGIAKIKEKSARYLTIGQMFVQDPEFADKKRNHSGEYTHTVLRRLHEDEIAILFKKQRDFESEFSNHALEESYTALAFDQLPLQDSEKMLGMCPFEGGEKRASSMAYSFEKFRYVTKLVNIKIKDGSKSGRRLKPEELRKAVNGFGKGAKSISWKRLIGLLGLPKTTRFVGVGETTKDLNTDVARKKGASFGTNTLYKVIGEAAWNSLTSTPKVLDDIAHVLTFREDVGRIEFGLSELALEPVIFEALMQGVRDGAFASFAQAGHISTKAARNILPGLFEAKTYDKACDLSGYDHMHEHPTNLDALTNPVAKRAIVETMKQVNVLIREYGVRPGKIHVELGRDVGKGPDERGRIDKGMKDRSAARDKARTAFCELVDKENCSYGELQRYELWVEQGHRCMFCDEYRDAEDLCDNRYACEIEHILPLSRSHDNSWHNKVLACTKCNRNKGKKTPFEWFGHDAEQWAGFEYRVKALKTDGKIKGFKIRNLLIQDYDEREYGFIERNKNDMRYAARVINSELAGLYLASETKGKRRIRARNGAITARLRHLWGLDHLKYQRIDGKKTRIEDERHHAADAIVVAACSEALLQELTKVMQRQEEMRLPPLKLDNFGPAYNWPCDQFRQQVLDAIKHARVARSENRRARGAGHLATIRQIRIEDGNRITYERVGIDGLTRTSLERLKDPDRNQEVFEALSNWIAQGKPKGKLPTRKNGVLIKKITLRSAKNPATQLSGFEAHGGLVDNAAMVRVDVFEKEGKFYLVPIYVHQVADQKRWARPPNLAIVAGKHETLWSEIDSTFSFKFSMYPFSWIEATRRHGQIFEGYYRGTDRCTGAITLSDEYSRQHLIRGVGAKTLHSFKKFHVDRLGNRFEIKSEVRTWHGVVCT